jgi:hypothetical protein
MARLFRNPPDLVVENLLLRILKLLSLLLPTLEGAWRPAT